MLHKLLTEIERIWQFLITNVKYNMKHAQYYRQILVITGLILCSVSDGLIFGQMSGMIQALHGKGEIKLDNDDISWIGSTINLTCFCGFALAGAVTDHYGRRKSITILTLPVLLSWFMVYFAQDKITLLLSRLIVGLSFGGIVLLIYTNVGEYISPKLRSLILNISSNIGTAIGTMLGHILSIIMHWRSVALVCMIPTALSAIIPLFWVESPSWLATKKKFEESEKSFKALHVRSESSDQELKMLIENQKAGRLGDTKASNFLMQIRKLISAFKYKYFWKTNALIMIVSVYRAAGGKIFLNTLILSMLQEITQTSDILTYTCIIDGFLLLGSAMSCVLVSKFKMRKLLFLSGTIANIIQILLAFCLYFWPRNNDSTISWIQVGLLALYCIIVTAGPYAVLETLLTELYPLEIKSVHMFVTSALSGIMHAMNIHISIKISSAFGYHGIFFLNFIIIFLCQLYLYYYLPETKGRTLQEIELYFKSGSFEDNKLSSVNSEDTSFLN